MRIYFLLAMAAGASLVGAKCGGTGVGDPCTPEDEYLTGFSGFSQSEVNVESRSFQCETRVCLVNHFQGRVSCPYGQLENPEDSGLSVCMGTLDNRNSRECQPGGGLHADSCQVPDRDGSAWEDRIVPPVQPQLIDRQAVDAVYCSCRCGGVEGVEDAGATYCECPSGFVCEPLVDNLGLGKGNLAGSYCVKDGTSYDPGEPARFTCESSASNCNEDFRVEFSSNDRGAIGRNQKRGCALDGAICKEGDSCCDVSVTPCNANENDADRNCFGRCVNVTHEGVNESWCQHLDPETGNDIPGATERLYEVTREECKEGDTCGS